MIFDNFFILQNREDLNSLRLFLTQNLKGVLNLLSIFLFEYYLIIYFEIFVLF